MDCKSGTVSGCGTSRVIDCRFYRSCCFYCFYRSCCFYRFYRFYRSCCFCHRSFYHFYHSCQMVTAIYLSASPRHFLQRHFQQR